MKKLIVAVALTIALPAAAFAQTAPANPHAGHNMAANNSQDHSKCMAMDHSKMNMQGMNMSGMDHSKMSGMSMQGMEQCDAKPANAADKAKPSSTQKR